MDVTAAEPARRLAIAPRLLPLISSILYVAVLLGGIYFEAAGLCPRGSMVWRTIGFVAVLAFLLALEWAEWRRFAVRTRRVRIVALLLLRMALFEVVGALDCSGFSRSLYLLVPFAAYFSLGRRVSYVLATGYLGMLVVRLSLRYPGWYVDQERVSNLLMFTIGLVFTISMAAVAAEEEASRSRAERLLGDLEESHQQLRTYATQVAELATAEERNRLARDIHDSLGHHLTAISVQLEKATAFRERDAAAAEQALADARDSARMALLEARQSVGALREANGTFSLSAALAALTERMDDSRFIIDLTVVGEETDFGGPVLMTLYRAVQEGLTNARKHAEAGRVTVNVTLGERIASLVVTDDGRGFSSAVPYGHPPQRENGFGLRGMRERLDLVGGSLRVDSAVGRGTRLLVTIPRPSAPEPTTTIGGRP